MNKLILSFIFVLGSNVYAGPLSASFNQAEEAFRQKDASQAVLKLKEALMEHSNHPLVVAKSSQLLSKMKAEGMMSNLKLDWHMPDNLKYFDFEVRRRYSEDAGKVRFQVIAMGQLINGATLEQFQIIRYPNTVVIDKQAKIGDWEDETWDSVPAFWSGGERNIAPVEEGLYLINIKLKDQPMVNGWVILNDMNASADPVIERPKLNEEFKTNEPQFSWRRYASPEFKSDSEQRKLRVVVTQNSGPQYKEITTANFRYNADVTNYQIGDTKTPKHFSGATSLMSGDYAFVVVTGEDRSFGDMTLTRGALTSKAFKIK